MAKEDNQILVKDACIIIDLIELDLLKTFLLMHYDVITTSAVVSEITDETQRLYLESCIAKELIKTEDNGTLMDIMNLKEKYRGLSYADATVLEVAIRKSSTLLSADKLLRKAGVKEESIVHGTLWIIEILHYNRIITCEIASEKIKKLILINKRISSELCFSTIRKIEKEETTYHLNK